MRTMTLNVYKFDELTDTAKEKARDWCRDGLDYPWFDDALSSLKDFAESFGASVTDYEIGAWCPSYVYTNATPQTFRGVKLRDIDRDVMPTGYCLDATLYQTFHAEFKRTGDAFYAFNEAIDAGVSEIKKDWEWQYSDEAVDEMLAINEYEFFEDGALA